MLCVMRMTDEVCGNVNVVSYCNCQNKCSVNTHINIFGSAAIMKFLLSILQIVFGQ